MNSIRSVRKASVADDLTAEFQVCVESHPILHSPCDSGDWQALIAYEHVTSSSFVFVSTLLTLLNNEGTQSLFG